EICGRMLRVCDIPVLLWPELMLRDDLAGSENIEPAADDAYIDGEPGELEGHGILDRVDLDMPIPMDFRFAPHDRLPPAGWQLQQLCTLMLLEPGPPALLLATKRGPIIDRLDLFSNRSVQIVQRHEDAAG